MEILVSEHNDHIYREDKSIINVKKKGWSQGRDDMKNIQAPSLHTIVAHMAVY